MSLVVYYMHFKKGHLKGFSLSHLGLVSFIIHYSPRIKWCIQTEWFSDAAHSICVNKKTKTKNIWLLICFLRESLLFHVFFAGICRPFCHIQADKTLQSVAAKLSVVLQQRDAVRAINALPPCPWEETWDKRSCRKQLAGYPLCLCRRPKNTTVPFSEGQSGWWQKIGRAEIFSFHMLILSVVFFMMQTGGPVGLRWSPALVCKYYESDVFVSLSFLCNRTQTEEKSENILCLSECLSLCFLPLPPSQSAFETRVTWCSLFFRRCTALTFALTLNESNWLRTEPTECFGCSNLRLFKKHFSDCRPGLPEPPRLTFTNPSEGGMRSVPREGLCCFVFCLQDRSLIALQYFPPHTRSASPPQPPTPHPHLPPICYLQTVALRMHALVRIVRLFRSTIALGFGSRTERFYPGWAAQLRFPRSFISNSLSASQGETWWHVLGFQSLEISILGAARHKVHHSPILDRLLKWHSVVSGPVCFFFFFPRPAAAASSISETFSRGMEARSRIVYSFSTQVKR